MRVTFVVLALLACTSGPAGEGPNETWAFAVAQPDCAPWDGAATTVILSDTPSDSVQARPFLTISAYRGLDGVRGRRFPLDGQDMDGAGASYCVADGGCEAATAGWVEFEPAEAGAALRGQYNLIFRDGTRRTGRFSAPIRERQALCG